MKRPILEEMNNERFLREAFDEVRRKGWIKATRTRRQVYLVLFVTGLLCAIYTGLVHWMTLCVLSIFLATLSLVIMSKYDTQLRFLKILQQRDEQQHVEPNHS